MNDVTTPSWLSETVVMTAREAIYSLRARDKPDGVYEPFLGHPEWKAANLSLLVCCTSVSAHEDHHELPPWCHFAVLVNDGWVAKTPRERISAVPPQRPGALFRLNIHDEHHLVRDRRVRSAAFENYPPGYAVLVLSQEEPIPDAEIGAAMQEAFDKVAPQFDHGMPDFYRRRW